MTWQPAEYHPSRHDGAPGALRALALTAVCVGIAALAAATFVLSYPDIRAVALQAGLEPSSARAYPFLLDAMLVIALAAALALRGAGVPSRMLSWLTLLAVLGAAAGAGVLHATGRRLPHNAAATTAAVLPWALVLVAFVLLLAMLRHARLRRQIARSRVPLPYAVTVAPEPGPPGLPGPGEPRTASPGQKLPVRTPETWHSVPIVPGFTSQLVSSAAAGAAAGAAAAEVAAAEPDVQEAGRDAGDETGVPDDSDHAGAEHDSDHARAEHDSGNARAEDDSDHATAEAELPVALTGPAAVQTDQAELATPEG